MTLLPLLYWTLLLIPGFAIARRLMPDELEGGLLPGIAVSWMTTFAVLAPFLVVGYVIRVPIWMPTLLVGGLVLWGLIDLWRTGAWRGVGRLMLASLCLELALVIVEVVYSTRHGAILAADARVHVARIRFLFDHGLSNLDPFVGGENFYPIYHTNLHHALYAIGSKLTFLDPMTFWFGSLAAAKVMIASGLAYLAWAVLGGRWAAWVAAIMVLVNRGPHTYSLYPNQLAPWFLVPVFLGVLARTLAAAWRSPEETWWRRLPRLGAVAVIVGMFHPLYAGFVVVIASPILLGTSAWRLVRRRPGIAVGIAGWLVVVACAMPFPFTGKFMTIRDRDRSADIEQIQRQVSGGRAGVELADDEGVDELVIAEAIDQGLRKEAPTVDQRERRLLKAPDGWENSEWGGRTMVARQLGRGFTGAYGKGVIKAWRVLVVLLAAGLAIWLIRRREAWYLLAAIAVIQFVVLFPPVATAALRFLGAQWMLQRFETLAFVLFIPLSMPAIAATVEYFLQPRLDRLRGGAILGRVVLAACTLLAIPVALAHASHRPPYDWDYYQRRVEAPLGYRLGREYRGLKRLERFLQDNIPPGSVVAVESFTGTRLKMLHDIELVASERSSTGVVDGGRRRIDLKLMFNFETEEEAREALFDKYGVTHVVVRGRPRLWMDWWDAESVRGAGYQISRLAEEPDLTQLWRRRLKQGLRLIGRKRYDEAVDRLREVVLEDPRLEKAWFHLGKALRGRGDAVEASAAFARAGELDPEDLRYPFSEGLLAFDAERYPQAIDAFDRARKLAQRQDDPGQEATAAFNLGNSWYMMDQLEEALQWYDYALELEPDYTTALEYRDLVAGYIAEDAGVVDQSEDDAGRPASPDENTPSASPSP